VQFITSHPGPFLMLALLALAALVALVILGVARLLPPEHPVRSRVEASWNGVKANPELVSKRMQQGAFVLIILLFTILTLVYS
jgi:hypothetical protein